MGEHSGTPGPDPSQHRVEAWDSDGVTVVAVGTLLFAVAAVVGLVLADRLTATGRGWWLDVALCGVALGLVGLAHTLHRRRRSATRRTP